MATTFCSVFKLNRNELLVFGYLRENFIDILIPLDLHNIFSEYINDVTEWKIKGTELQKFHNIGLDLKMNGPTFELTKYIHFQLKITPKYKYGDEQYTILWLTLNDKTLLKSIKDIQFYFVLYFIEGSFEYKHITTLSKGEYNTDQMWYTYSLKYSYTKNEKFNKLQFGCYVEILRINYHKNKEIKWLTNSLQIHKEHKYIWTLNKNEIKRFKQSQIDYSLYSENFNNNSFCIVIAPNGLSVYQQGNGLVFMKMKLLKLPPKIDQIKYKYHLKLIGYNQSKMTNKNCISSNRIEMNRFVEGVFNYSRTGLNSKDKDMKFELLKDVEYVKIIATMCIKKLYGVNGKEIIKDEWNKYGFIE
eukprot:446078_1